jgi:hypothetical protein
VTIPGYGRLTLLQCLMLGLAGEVLHRFRQEVSDEERMDQMVASRAELVEQTGQDFGFDLASWDAWLRADKQHRGEYMHSYGWRSTRRALESLVGDERRLRLVQELEAKGSAR